VDNFAETRHSDLDRLARHWLQLLNDSTDTAGIYASREQILQTMLVAARSRHTWATSAEIAHCMHPFMIRWGFVRSWIKLLQQVCAPALIPAPAKHLTVANSLDLGTALIVAGEWSAARKALLTTGRTFHQLGDQIGELKVRYHLGCLHWHQGGWQLSIQQLEPALQDIKSLPCTSPEVRHLHSQLLDLLGLSQWRLGQPRLALNSLHQALAKRLVSDPRGQAHTHHHILLSLIDLGDTTGALRHAAQAYRLFTESNDRVGLAYLLSDLSELHCQQDDTASARAVLQQAYRLWREMQDPRGLADYYRHAGNVERKAGEIGLAGEYFCYARDLWQALGDANEVQRCEDPLYG
jgi:tetratricopeptide (TPR) repeat protein